MAQVTVELRNLLRTDFELFDFEYEFDDQKMAKELEQAVIDYYYHYEIGQETPEAFKLNFKRRWLSAISYYNKLHNTTLLEYNPLINYKMSEALEKLSQSNRTQKTTHEDEGTSTSTNESHTDSSGTTSNNESIESTSTDQTEQAGSTRNTRTDDLKGTSITDEQASDYPQQAIAGGDYLSGARQVDTSTTNTGTVQDSGTNDSTTDSTSSGQSETTGSGTQQSTTDQTGEQQTNTTNTGEGSLIGEDINNENYEKTIEGLTGTTYQDLIMKERENILRISQMLIAELKPCFILVY